MINLHLKKSYESYFDEVVFESIRLGMKVFQEKILKPNLSKVFGIGFNFGQLNDDFLNSPLAQSKIEQYLEETYGDLSLQYRFEKEVNLFQISLIAEYLHRIASMIQEQIEIYASFDLRTFSLLETLQFISSDRFSYMRLGLKGCNLPSLGLNCGEGKMIGGTLGENVVEPITPKIGLLFPSDHKLTEGAEKDFEQLLQAVIQLNIPFYVLYEESMTENWQNLEKVIVHSKFMDPLLKRKCQGFAAADGVIVSYGERIGVFEEVSFSDL